MKRIAGIKTEQTGAALIIAIGVMSIMLVVAVMVTAISINSNKTVSHDKRQTEARNVAEAGIDDAISYTISNFNTVYPGGAIPVGTSANPNGPALFNGDQTLTDDNGNPVGTYEIYTKQDPDTPGNVLVTAKAAVDGSISDPAAYVETVRVSVNYTAPAFDFALFPGSPDNPIPATATFSTMNGGGDDGEDHGGSNIKVTGKVNVNGSMVIQAKASGDEEDHKGRYGTVLFVPRQGYTDGVTYTGTYTGTKPSGTQPTPVPSPVAFPKVNFSKFTMPPFPNGSIATVSLPASGTLPSGGWSRSTSNGSTVFSISATNFQNEYQSYMVVKLTSTSDNAIVNITGDCSSPAITPTIMTEGKPGSSLNIKELHLIGPGLKLQPTDGLAILSGEGLVSLETDVVVGAVHSGALIYLSGENGVSSLQVTGDLVMYGSVIVNGNVNMTAQGVGERDDNEENHHNPGVYCGEGDEDEGHATNIFLSFEGSYLNNPNLPRDWWTWTGGGGITAIKYNYDKG